MNDLAKRVALRFLRAFAAGAVASVLALIASGTSIKSLTDIQALALPLVIAAVTGGLMAVDKLLRDAPSDVPPQALEAQA